MRRLVLVAALVLCSVGGVDRLDSQERRDVRDSARWVQMLAGNEGNTTWLDTWSIVRTAPERYEIWMETRYAQLRFYQDRAYRKIQTRAEIDCARLMTRAKEGRTLDDAGETTWSFPRENGDWASVTPGSHYEAIVGVLCDRVRGANLPITRPTP